VPGFVSEIGSHDFAWAGLRPQASTSTSQVAEITGMLTMAYLPKSECEHSPSTAVGGQVSELCFICTCSPSLCSLAVC
jgi:hypothetical protein